jgi:hypothetical protein
MNPENVVVRFDKVSEQAAGPVLRIVGLVKAKDSLQLFDSADLEANPRSAKAGAVTEDILESIQDTPDIFAFKTKGVLVGASEYKGLQRNRYELNFINPKIEGILDGGHNMLAIGTHILTKALRDPAVKKRIKNWPDFKELWSEHRVEIEALKKASNGEGGGELDFLIPLEILVPSDLTNSAVVEQFNNSLLSICSARNNNVELTLETRANKKGYYEDLRVALPSYIADRVEWKTNDGGDIKVRDLIALAWIPLSALSLDYIPRVAPQNIYRNKGECAKQFDELMGMDEVSKPTDGEYTRALHNAQIRSALTLAGELPALYDKIYEAFPYAYNNDGDGKFGRISIVKMAKDMRTAPTSHFTDQSVEYSYPDGLIMPIVYGLKALMQVGGDGKVHWKQDPMKFIESHLAAIVRKYRIILDAFGFDPQKVGKNEGSYTFVIDAFETELMRQQQDRKR